jgi:MFS family permease
VLRFLLGWVAWETTHSAFWVGAIAGLMLVPTFLLSPLFGITADRINPRNGLLVTIALQGAIAALAGLVAWFGLLGLGWLTLLAVLFGAVTSAHTPIRLALLPRLVERQALPSAIGYSAIVFNSGRIVGPAIGAWLLLHATVPVVFAVSAIAMFIATAMVLRVQGVRGADTERDRSSFMSQLRAGVRYVRGHDAIRLVFLLTLTSGLLGRTLIELLPAVSGQILSGDSTTLATLTASAGAGSITGGLIVSRQGGRLSELYWLSLGGLAAGALTLLSASAWHTLWQTAVAVGLVSLCTTVIGTGNQALTQLMVEEGYRGRVMSLWTVVAMGTPAIGAVLVGSAADRVGFPVALMVIALLALVVVFFSARRLRASGALRRAR